MKLISGRENKMNVDDDEICNNVDLVSEGRKQWRLSRKTFDERFSINEPLIEVKSLAFELRKLIKQQRLTLLDCMYTKRHFPDKSIHLFLSREGGARKTLTLLLMIKVLFVGV